MQNGSSLIYYRGGLIYNGNDLDKIIHEEGLVVKSSGGYNYYYALKDHLGSTRVLCKASGSTLTTEQTTEYYPFGLAFSYNSVDKNSYLFSGKEYQNEVIGGTKLELYDFGSRYYDTELGRWSAVDPAMQLVSPYGYCMNNPMIYVDPDGECFWAFLLVFLGNIAINTADKMINHDMPFKDAFMNSLQLPEINVGIGDWKPFTQGMYAQSVEKGMTEFNKRYYKSINCLRDDFARSEGVFSGIQGFGLSFEIAFPDWVMGDLSDYNGVGIDVGIIEDGKGMGLYATTKHTKESGFAFTGQVEVFRNRKSSAYSNQVYMEDMRGKGYETSLGIGPVGGSYSQSNTSYYGKRSLYQIYSISLGTGLDIGFVNWNTNTHIYIDYGKV